MATSTPQSSQQGIDSQTFEGISDVDSLGLDGDKDSGSRKQKLTNKEAWALLQTVQTKVRLKYF